MKCTLIIEESTNFDGQIEQLYESAKQSKPENHIGFSDEEAAAKQALEKKLQSFKNKNAFIIRHGGSYTTIGVSAHAGSRVALITYAPGVDENEEEVYTPYGSEWKKEMSKLTIKKLEEMWGVKLNKDAGERKKELIEKIAIKLQGMTEEERASLISNQTAK